MPTLHSLSLSNNKDIFGYVLFEVKFWLMVVWVGIVINLKLKNNKKSTEGGFETLFYWK